MRGTRRRIATGIYRDASGIALVVWLHGRSYERRVPAGDTLADLRRQRAALMVELRRIAPAPAARGTFAADVDRYVELVPHLAGVVERRSELRAWGKLVGRKSRRSITRADVLEARSAWIDAGVAPKTVNNRVTALRAMYHLLDGPDAATPADGVKALIVRQQPPVPVSSGVIGRVYRNLQTAETAGVIRDARTRARFRLLAETGRRPSEIMRTEPDDFDLERGVWFVRDGKGGFTPGGVFLTESIRAAVVEFIAADAFGPFNTGSFARVLRHAGWPADVRPYNLRHSVGMALADAGADHMDIAAALGHRDPRTTRRHYVGIRDSRTRAALERIGGRVVWTDPAPDSASDSRQNLTPDVAPTHGTDRKP